MQKPFTQLGQRHNIIRQFTPNWFTVSMGTGVVALIVSEFPMLKALTWQKELPTPPRAPRPHRHTRAFAQSVQLCRHK
jgi:hypothetical protein